MPEHSTGGPLHGLRVLEFAGLGPAPFAGMVLADYGADVLVIDRPPGRTGFSVTRQPRFDLVRRGRRSAILDLTDGRATDAALELAAVADVLIEGFRPGVMERLGLGPDVCLARNPRLLYARMTGWGQHGITSERAGHDLNYIGVTGALHAIGRAGASPTAPLNLVGDFGGGAMFLVAGVLAALWERQRSGSGQVIDAAIVDGTALLTTMVYGMLADGSWIDEPGRNLLDGSCPWYDSYPTADGKWVAVAALEPKFFAALVVTLGIAEEFPEQPDRARWPVLRTVLAEVIGRHSRAHWESTFAGVDACVTPVLSLGEAPAAPVNARRQVFDTVDGTVQPAPAPRFSRTPGHAGSVRLPGADTTQALSDWGISNMAQLLEAEVAIDSGSGRS